MEMIIKSPKYGEFIIFFDEEDYDKIKRFKWHINFHGKNVYATTVFRIKDENNKTKSITYKMHRLIMGFPSNQIDHIDNNGLNNQKNNLRIVTHKQNQLNKRSYRNTTGFKGVCFSKKMGKYQAYLKSNGVNKWGGYHDTPIEAAKKYNELAIKYHGEFAFLNKIPNE